jgi:acetoin utilization deacetylase AcuC-like enzyme
MTDGEEMRVGFIYDPIYLKHDTGEHPENAKRLLAVMRYLERTGPWQKLVSIKPVAAGVDDITLVHERQYISYIREMAEKGGGRLDPDTVMSAGSYDAARYAAGGVISAADAVIGGQLDSAFALVRPPGHHATAGRAMGFCLFNNVAIAARHALKEYSLERIAIIDFDVHHGNGTQGAFYSEPNVLYISTHQSHFFPGTGSIEETGGKAARGTNVNIPLPAGCGDGEYTRVFDQVVVPLVRRFKPQLVMVSAGYDGHWADGLAMMQLSITGFARIVRVIKEMADEVCRGHTVFCLEGGYNLTVLSASVRATFEVLLGNKNIEDKLGQLPFEVRPPDITALIERIKKVHNLS